MKNIILFFVLSTCFIFGDSWSDTRVTGNDIVFMDGLIHLVASDEGVSITSYDPDYTLWYRTEKLAQNSQGHVFALTDGYGLFCSKDGGQSWTLVLRLAPALVPDNDYKYYHLSIDSSDNIFVSAPNNGIFYSTDNGQTWQENSEYVFSSIVSNSKGELFASSHSYVLKSKIGKTKGWEAIPHSVFEPNQLVINAQDHIFAAGSDGTISRSIDNGETWEELYNLGSFYPVQCLAINKKGHIFAGIYRGGVMYSTDNGKTWKSFNEGLAYTDVRDLKIDDNGTIHAFTDGGIWSYE